MIDKATVQRITDTADIVDVVSDYVHLIRRGSNFMGLCPFHNERTPSFSVNKQRNFCYCFSCKKGGSPVNFIMEKEGLSYHEALLHLAKKYGIEVVERELSSEERERQSAREAMFVANEWAMHVMEKDLLETDEGRDIGLQYFTQRGVTDEAIKAFHLGYAIDKGNHLTEKARHSGFNLDILKKLGLVGTSQQGRDYDRFRGRVIFPILNPAGKTIAFGGRDLKGGLAKYINSPESELYKKSNELYGIFQAKASIVRENKCYLVEGYMDVIGMWQSGMKNVVASSGTALTDGQIAMIHRFTENITLIYDGDAAGIKASLRGIDMLLSHRLNVKVLLLPDGDDPDSFARKHTADEFQKYVEQHETDIIRFKAQVMLDSVKNDPHNRINAINSVIESIAHIPDQVARDVYVQECSEILGISDVSIAKGVGAARHRIVENLKRERLRKSIGEDTPPSNDADSQIASQNHITNIAQTPQINSDALASSPRQKLGQTPNSHSSNPEKQYPLYPLEKAVIRYCIRYAFVDFELVEENSDERISVSVIDYINEELGYDNITFSYPPFHRIFTLLTGMKEDFNHYYESKKISIDQEIEDLRQENYRLLASKDLSVSDIHREETRKEEELTVLKESKIREIAKAFSANMLVSHEDDEIRRISTALVIDKHQLSNIYLKDGVTETEEQRLPLLITRSLVEWRNEILNQRIKEIFKELKEIAGKGQEDQERKLQLELNELMMMRREAAKQIGDRVIYNSSKDLLN